MKTKITTAQSLGAVAYGVGSMLAGQIAATFLSGILYGTGAPAWLCNSLLGLLYVAVTGLLVRLFCTATLKSTPEAVGLDRKAPDSRWITAALVLPTGVYLVYFLFGGRFVPVSQTPETMTAGIFFMGIGSGLVIEMVFRGIILHSLAGRFGPGVAVVVPSVLLGLFQIVGMPFDLLPCLQIVLAGTLLNMMYSLIALESGSVWNSALVHVVWNLCMGSLLGVATADMAGVGGALMELQVPVSAVALTGGGSGPAYSLVSAAGYLAVSLVALRSIRAKKQRAEA